MVLTDVILKPSVLEFEDKHKMRDSHTGIYIPNEEKIQCKIPELDLGEKIVLNAWGNWYEEDFHEYRRRLGIYSVTSKECDYILSYILKEETKIRESDIAHQFLSGNYNDLADSIRNLRYVFLPKF